MDPKSNHSDEPEALSQDEIAALLRGEYPDAKRDSPNEESETELEQLFDLDDSVELCSPDEFKEFLSKWDEEKSSDKPMPEDLSGWKNPCYQLHQQLAETILMPKLESWIRTAIEINCADISCVCSDLNQDASFHDSFFAIIKEERSGGIIFLEFARKVINSLIRILCGGEIGKTILHYEFTDIEITIAKAVASIFADGLKASWAKQDPSFHIDSTVIPIPYDVFRNMPYGEKESLVVAYDIRIESVAGSLIITYTPDVLFWVEPALAG